MNIYNITFKAKKNGHEFTIGVEAHGQDEKNAKLDAMNHIKRNYKDVEYAVFNSIEYVETVKSRIDKLKQWKRD